MSDLKRKYTQRTLKVLFALSGNQCAHPDCTNTLIEPATEHSNDHVAAQICHIYAISDDGPRGKSGLLEDELNSPENLVLMCSYHPKSLVDHKIKEETSVLRKSRFFVEFDKIQKNKNLGSRILEGELSGGTNSVKCAALAWCARLHTRTNDLTDAEKYLCEAKALDSCVEISIAEAFLLSQKGEKAAALSILADIQSPASRTAALMIVAYHEGNEKALQWLNDADVDMSDLDADGKYFLLSQQIEASTCDDLRISAEKISVHDLEEAPVLNHILAVTWLSFVVPEELRSAVLYQLPFNASDFPLASDVDSLEARKKSKKRECNI